MADSINVLRQKFMLAVTAGELEQASALYLEIRPNIQDEYDAGLIDSVYMTLLSSYKKDNL